MKKVFLSYARKNAAKATKLYRELSRLPKVDVWFDKKSLLPGIRWKPAIRAAVRKSDFFIALLSNYAVSNRGFRHTELREALDVLDEVPEGKVFLIPVRLDECPMPLEELKQLNYVDLFPKWKKGVSKIKTALGVKKPSKGKKKRSRKGTRSGTVHRNAIIAYEYRIGLADLDIGLTNLPQLAQELNQVQSYFHFTLSKLQITQRVVANFEGDKNIKVYRLPRSFYRESIHLNVDHVICLTKYFLAFEDDDHIQYNYIGGPSPYDERFEFLSVGGLNNHARNAGVKFETALVFLITSQLVSYFTDVGYHDAFRACPMDFTESHEQLVPGLKKASFCRRCLKGLSKNNPLYKAVINMLEWGRNT
jgi:hypothetical protein